MLHRDGNHFLVHTRRSPASEVIPEAFASIIHLNLDSNSRPQFVSAQSISECFNSDLHSNLNKHFNLWMLSIPHRSLLNVSRNRMLVESFNLKPHVHTHSEPTQVIRTGIRSSKEVLLKNWIAFGRFIWQEAQAKSLHLHEYPMDIIHMLDMMQCSMNTQEIWPGANSR